MLQNRYLYFLTATKEKAMKAMIIQKERNSSFQIIAVYFKGVKSSSLRIWKRSPPNTDDDIIADELMYSSSSNIPTNYAL